MAVQNMTDMFDKAVTSYISANIRANYHIHNQCWVATHYLSLSIKSSVTDLR